jgi:hypothetical protein
MLCTFVILLLWPWLSKVWTAIVSDVISRSLEELINNQQNNKQTESDAVDIASRITEAANRMCISDAFAQI